jgi:hypothetical protein
MKYEDFTYNKGYTQVYKYYAKPIHEQYEIRYNI